MTFKYRVKSKEIIFGLVKNPVVYLRGLGVVSVSYFINVTDYRPVTNAGGSLVSRSTISVKSKWAGRSCIIVYPKI